MIENVKHPNFYEHSIVLVGNFNPKIFHPSWFAAEGLIGKQEAEKANIEIIHPDVAIFSLDWLRLEVVQDRLIAQTIQQTHDELVRDLVLGTFTFLRHTPLKQMGINKSMHFQMDSIEQWHEAGHKLAPKEIWDGILERPGMRSVKMEETPRRDGLKGHIQVLVEPSPKVKPGLFINVNDHIQVDNPKDTLGSEELMNVLRDIWTISNKRSENIIYQLLEKVS